MSRPLRTLPSPLDVARAFVCLATTAVRARWIYRNTVAMTFLANALGYSVTLLVWRQVYRQTGTVAAALAPDRLYSYLSLAFTLNYAISTSIEGRVGQRISSGLIAIDYTRPLAFMPFQAAYAVGDLAVNSFVAMPSFLAAGWFLQSAVAPPNTVALLTGICSAGVAFLLNFAISYLMVQAFFVVQTYYGITYLRVALHQVFSGLSGPLLMFPPGLAKVARWLPFRHVIETPVTIWLGFVPPQQVPTLLAQQLLWAVSLLAAATFLFRVVIRHLQVHGG